VLPVGAVTRQTSVPLRAFEQLEPDEEVVAAVGGLRCEDRDLRNVARTCVASVVTGEEKHHIGVRLSHQLGGSIFAICGAWLGASARRRAKGKQTGEKN